MCIIPQVSGKVEKNRRSFGRPFLFCVNNVNQALDEGREAQKKVSSTFSKVVGVQGAKPLGRAPQSAKHPGRAGKKVMEAPCPARPKRLCRQGRQTAPSELQTSSFRRQGFRYPAQLLEPHGQVINEKTMTRLTGEH